MLNKIKIIGEVSPIEIREKEKNQSMLYFSLSVINPNRSLTILRCVAQGEKAEEIERDVKGGEVLEIKGYLRNENFRNENSSRQILIRVVNFIKLDITTDKIDNTQSNQVQLLGKIVTDFEKGDSDVLSFRIAVPREGNTSPLFFCRAQGKLIGEMSSKLKKGDIILLEGFLQTKKIDEETETGRKFSRISSIICQAFTFLDNDSANNFNPLNDNLKLNRVVGEIKEIDFTKPKEITK